MRDKHTHRVVHHRTESALGLLYILGDDSGKELELEFSILFEVLFHRLTNHERSSMTYFHGFTRFLFDCFRNTLGIQTGVNTGENGREDAVDNAEIVFRL